MTELMRLKVSIRETIYNKVGDLLDVTRLDKQTIFRMAIYHGIERLKEGYEPQDRIGKNSSARKQQIEVKLPKELYDRVNEIHKTYDIGRGRLIDYFLEIECRRLVYNSTYTTIFDGKTSTDSIEYRLHMPAFWEKQIALLSDKAGINHTQIIQYLLYIGYCYSVDNKMTTAFVPDNNVKEFARKNDISENNIINLLDFILKSDMQSAILKKIFLGSILGELQSYILHLEDNKKIDINKIMTESSSILENIIKPENLYKTVIHLLEESDLKKK